MGFKNTVWDLYTVKFDHLQKKGAIFANDERLKIREETNYLKHFEWKSLTAEKFPPFFPKADHEP